MPYHGSSQTRVMDLCLLNAVLGISSHGGKLLCTFCDGPSTLELGTLKTLKDLRLNYEAYQAAGANPSQMKKFANIIQPCLISAPQKEKVISVVILVSLAFIRTADLYFCNALLLFSYSY